MPSDNIDARPWVVSYRLMYLVVFLLTILSLGCAALERGVSPPACRPLPPGVVEALGDGNRTGTLKAMADGEAVAMGRRLPLQLAVMAAVPDRLYLEVVSPLGPSDLLLVVRGEEMRVLLSSRGEFYRGRVGEHLSRFLPVAVDQRDLVTFLTGWIPLTDGALCLRTEDGGDAAAGLIGLDRRGSDGRVVMSLWLREEGKTLARAIAYGEGGETLYTVTASETIQVGPLKVPGRLVIRLGEGRGSVTLRLRDAEFVTDETWPLPEAPPGVKVIDLG